MFNVGTLVELLKSHKLANKLEAIPRGDAQSKEELRIACKRLAIPNSQTKLNLRSHAEFEEFGFDKAIDAIRRLDIEKGKDYYDRFGLNGAADRIRERDSSGGYRLKTADDFAQIGLGPKAVIKRLDLRTYGDYHSIGPDAAADQLFLRYRSDPTNVRYDLGKMYDPASSPPVTFSFKELHEITMRAYYRQNGLD